MTIITNNYNDINNLIRMAYDFFYNQNKTLCYSVKPVNLQDVEDYTSVKRVYNKNQTYSFINNFLNDRITFVKKILTIYGNKFIFKKINDPYSVNLTINVYTDTDEQNNLSNPQNINKVFLKLFSDFLSYEQTKHIMLQILNIDVQLIDIEEFFVNSNIPELKQFIDAQNVVNKVVSIGITEHFFKLIYLNDFLTVETCSNWTDEHYKALIFQILHTLCLIQNKYPNFRHNGLNVKNMEGYLKTINNSTDKYSFNGINYEIVNIGFVYKMNHFESSTIVDILVNDQLDEYMRTVDRTYDIKKFIESLKKHLESIKIKLPGKTKNFLNKDFTYETTSAFMLDEYFDSLKIMRNKNKNDILGSNKNNKQDIIENKKSNNNLSEDMPSQSFLFKGSRTINSNTNTHLNDIDSKSIKSNRINKSKKSITESDVIISGVRNNAQIQKTKLNLTHSESEASSVDVEAILGIKEDEKENTRITHTNKQKSKSKIANALKSTNNEITTGLNHFPTDITNLPNTNGIIIDVNTKNQQTNGMMQAQMSMPQMSMPQMQMPQMSMSQMSMPQMSMPQMSMPQMASTDPFMAQMQMPQMSMPQMAPTDPFMAQMQMPQMVPPTSTDLYSTQMSLPMPVSYSPNQFTSQMQMANLLPNMAMQQFGQTQQSTNRQPINQQMNHQLNQPDMATFEKWFNSNTVNGQNIGQLYGGGNDDDGDTEDFFFR
jgi:hypothetical protein